MKNLIYIVLFFVLFSCGARKVDKQNSEVKVKMAIVENKTEQKTEKKDSISEIKTEIKNDIVTTEDVIEPIDSTNPIESVDSDGKVTKYKNARIRHKKIVDNTQKNTEQNVIQSNTIDSQIELKINEKTDAVSKTTIKKTTKEQFNWSTFILSFWWLWLIIIIAIIIIKKYYFPQLNLLEKAKRIFTKLKN